MLVITREFPAAYEAFTVQVDDPAITVIGVGISDNYERQRFSIAHELGHIESGRASAEIHAMPDYERNPDEIWADNFARHLLLPIASVEKNLAGAGRSRHDLTIKSLSDLVRVFGVSPPVAMIQLRDSGWIAKTDSSGWSEAHHPLTSRSLAMKYGWDSERDAMVNASLTPRRPTRLVSAATSAYQDGKASLEAVAQAAGEKNLEQFQSKLRESGITVGQAAAKEPKLEAEDLSDLYRGSE